MRLVAGHYRRIGINGSVLEESPWQRIRTQYYTEFLRRNRIAVPATVIYRRSALETVGNFDIEAVPCEDYDLYLRIARQFPIHCYGQVVAEYRQHGANVTSNAAVMLEAALTVLRRQWSHVQGNASYEDAYRAGMRFYRGYYGAQIATQRDSLAVIETLEVSLCELNGDQLWGCNLEAPQARSRTAGHVIGVVGWVLGRCAPARAVEVVCEGTGARTRVYRCGTPGHRS